MLTIKQLTNLISKDIDQFEHYKSSFLDEFYSSSTADQCAMIAEEPDPSYKNLPKRILPFLAGMVEKLCRDHDLTCPDWIFDNRYYLDKPNFWLDARGNLRLLLLAETPVEFKIRNVFTTANTLDRV